MTAHDVSIDVITLIAYKVLKITMSIATQTVDTCQHR